MSATGTFTCLCDTTGWEVSGEPAISCYCHCKSCRVYGGDASQVAGYTPEQFKLTKGEDNLIKYESAPSKFRHTCKTCGCMIYNILPNGLKVVPLGGINWADDGKPVVPNMHIFVGDKGLEDITDGLPQHESFP
ncbi:hypothetical protein SARC_01878 [Sphaeroforma arctica JP610]|uniref:CENP-V/GFA domain-containing protein n=1 Tax=Sphaeroforma arctica JP610 TaxID=667725 RepID=A0A0L0GAN6_9EUKA|nr:hypothetical protein SARC_01878 [Sphaeroforma arctica JP610]KNC85974.1 hypothetical protein SARC_01878 [Sphaeroforma arctica JP610]|eukprot:XP_014159876.1 hypothetical protein SARC_01878 [Sphaeroforma arctica JP610]